MCGEVAMCLSTSCGNQAFRKLFEHLSGAVSHF